MTLGETAFAMLCRLHRRQKERKMVLDNLKKIKK
jgi:hypothetical protein